MADSSVAITAGSGTNIDTRTEGTNSEHRQVVVIGDPATNAGVSPVDATLGLGVDVKGMNGVATTMGNGVSGTGVQRVTIASDSTGNLATIGTSVTPGTAASNLGKAEDAAHTSGDTGVMVLGVRRDVAAASSGTDGDYEPLSTDNTGRLRIAVAPANSGVDIGDVDVLSLPASTNTIEVVGDVAHDAVSAGNPVAVGGAARSSRPTAVAAADRAEFYTDLHGGLHTRSGHQAPAGAIWTAIHVPAANTQATATKAAAGVGVRNVITEFSATIVGGTTAPAAVNVVLNLIDGASGGTTYLKRVQFAFPATAGEVRGIAMSNLWLPGSANTGITIEFAAAGGANTIESVSMSGVTITE